MSKGTHLPRITEPDEGADLVHYTAPGLLDQVTLCGLTDFIGHSEQGESTKRPATCRPCLAMVEFVLTRGKSG